MTTIPIPLSLSGPADAFANAVEEHCAALESHAAGMEGVPVPTAHGLVEMLIVRVPRGDPLPDTFVILPYTFVDDTPPLPPPPSLEERKTALNTMLQTAATTIQNDIFSPARANLLELDAVQAFTVPESQRNIAQSGAIAAYTAFQSRRVEIQRNAAVAAVEIEDLTERTIGAWKVPSL